MPLAAVMGRQQNCFYDAFILLVAAAALGAWLSKWLAPAAAWVIGVCLLLGLVIDRVVGLYFGLAWYWTLAVVALAVSLVSCVMAWLG